MIFLLDPRTFYIAKLILPAYPFCARVRGDSSVNTTHKQERNDMKVGFIAILREMSIASDAEPEDVYLEAIMRSNDAMSYLSRVFYESVLEQMDHLII